MAVAQLVKASNSDSNGTGSSLGLAHFFLCIEFLLYFEAVHHLVYVFWVLKTGKNKKSRKLFHCTIYKFWVHCFYTGWKKSSFLFTNSLPLSLNLFDKGKCVFLRWFSFHFHFAMSKQNCLMMMMVLLMPEREIFYHSSLNNIWLFKKMIVILQNGFLEIWWCNGSTTIILSFHLRERENFVKTFSEGNYTIL